MPFTEWVVSGQHPALPSPAPVSARSQHLPLAGGLSALLTTIPDSDVRALRARNLSVRGCFPPAWHTGGRHQHLQTVRKQQKIRFLKPAVCLTWWGHSLCDKGSKRRRAVLQACNGEPDPGWGVRRGSHGRLSRESTGLSPLRVWSPDQWPQGLPSPGGLLDRRHLRLHPGPADPESAF